jgi:hypothetical protein
MKTLLVGASTSPNASWIAVTPVTSSHRKALPMCSASMRHPGARIRLHPKLAGLFGSFEVPRDLFVENG